MKRLCHTLNFFEAMKWLCHTCRLYAKGSTPSGRQRRSSARSGRSQQLWTLPSQTIRASFFICANILLTRDFCQREILVDTRFLSTREFCLREIFVYPRFLSTRDFCWRESFVGARFLLTQEFLLYIISFISNSRKGKIIEIFSLLLGDGVVHFDYQHYVN